MTTDQITEPDRLTSLADMADAAWQSVRGIPHGPQTLQATKALRDMDGKRQELKVYLRECQDSIRRAYDEAIDINREFDGAVEPQPVFAEGDGDETPTEPDPLTAAAQNLADLLGTREMGYEAGQHLRCEEADAVATVMALAGRAEAAEQWLLGHSAHDFPDNDHFPYLPEGVTAYVGRLVASAGK